MEHELRELGNRLMKEMFDEWKEAVDEGGVGGDPQVNALDVLDGMNNVEMLAVMYVTATAGEAFASVMDEIAECVVENEWAWQ